jgi:hypothetical protein
MGWTVIGFGNIDVPKDKMADIIDLMIGDKKKVADRLKGEFTFDDFFEVEGTDGTITFRMEGNKGIDTKPLDNIKDYCKANNIPVGINMNEYTESGEGYWYNNEEDDE